jgi:hypothetical protein
VLVNIQIWNIPHKEIRTFDFKTANCLKGISYFEHTQHTFLYVSLRESYFDTSIHINLKIVIKLIFLMLVLKCEPGISVSIMSGYGLNDRSIKVRPPAEAKGFFSVASVSRPALGPTPVQWVPGVLSSGLKHGQGVTLTTHPYLVSRSRMSRSCTSSPPSAFVAINGKYMNSSRIYWTFCISHPIEVPHRTRH